MKPERQRWIGRRADETAWSAPLRWLPCGIYRRLFRKVCGVYDAGRVLDRHLFQGWPGFLLHRWHIRGNIGHIGFLHQPRSGPCRRIRTGIMFR